jgi:hypothetical protein
MIRASYAEPVGQVGWFEHPLQVADDDDQVDLLNRLTFLEEVFGIFLPKICYATGCRSGSSGG